MSRPGHFWRRFKVIKKQFSIIHVAKKQLGLDDIAYRAILSGAGVSSSKDIKTDIQFNTVMSAFQQLGFRSTSWAGKRINSVPGAPGMISRRQEYYIKGLWALASRFKDEKSLCKMIRRIGKVDDISFLSRRSASALILALRDICWKAGFNPDTKEDIYVSNSKENSASFEHGDSASIPASVDGGNRSNQSWQILAHSSGSSG
jgi:hypothetical protein